MLPVGDLMIVCCVGVPGFCDVGGVYFLGERCKFCGGVGVLLL